MDGEALFEPEDILVSISDLIITLLWLGLTVLCIFLPVLNGSIFRVIFALPSILFLPGYALIAALFPGREDLDAIERIALSFGLSIAVVPLIGLALNYTPWGIRLEPVVNSLVLLTSSLVVLSGVRRLSLPLQERFTVPWGRIATDIRNTVSPLIASRTDRALNLILLLSILVAVFATIYVITVPKEGEHFTEFYILGEKGKAADYPRDLVMGTEYRLIIGVGNHEYRNVTYTVECHLLNMTFDPATNTSSLHAMRELDSFPVDLPHNSTKEILWSFTVADPGYNRLEFLLFNETVPDDRIRSMDRINASYRDLHLWVEMQSYIP
jgi:Predicted membrane protein